MGGERLAHLLHRAAFWIVTVGITLSSLHHTSLGSLFLVTPQRLHPLWYTPRLPVHFILSAMGAGLMVVVLAKLLHSHWYDREAVFGAGTGCTGAVSPEKRGEPPCVGPDFPMVRQLATLAAGVLAVSLVVKLADLWATGAWRSLRRRHLGELVLRLRSAPRLRDTRAGHGLGIGASLTGAWSAPPPPAPPSGSSGTGSTWASSATSATPGPSTSRASPSGR